jgi:hypothetical protein
LSSRLELKRGMGSRYGQAIALGIVLLLPLWYSYAFFFESLSHNVREIYTYSLDSML